MSAPKLYWLPEVPDWNHALKSATAADQKRSWQNFVALTNTRIDFIRTQRLDSTVRRDFHEASLSSLSTKDLRLAVLGSSTIDSKPPALCQAAASEKSTIIRLGSVARAALDMQ